MAEAEASDSERCESSRVDRVDPRTTDHDQGTCFKWRDYNGRDETARSASRPPDRDPRGVIKRVL